jgi:hypothetical protein
VAQVLLYKEGTNDQEDIMGHIIQLPLAKENGHHFHPKSQKLVTQGDHWVFREKKLLDKAEFLEAMILVLDDVRLQNIRSRDYAMMEIITEEIPRYEQRLETIKGDLQQLREAFWASKESIAN